MYIVKILEHVHVTCASKLMYFKFEKNRICREISFHKQDKHVLVVWGLMCFEKSPENQPFKLCMI